MRNSKGLRPKVASGADPTGPTPKPEAPGSSPGGDTSSATKSLGKPRILFFFWIFQNRAVGTISHT